jgi:hypothetical protein
MKLAKLYTGAKALTGEDGKIDQTKVDEKTAWRMRKLTLMRPRT